MVASMCKSEYSDSVRCEGRSLMQRFVAGSGTTINSLKICTTRVLEYVSILHGFEGIDNSSSNSSIRAVPERLPTA